MSEEEKGGKEHFKEGKKHLEKGTQRVLEQGIEKSKEQRKKLQYYQENRSELIEDFSSRIGNPKKPAVSGLIVLLPVFTTLLVVSWLFEKIAQIPGNRYFNISQYTGILESGSIPAYYLNQTLKLSMLLAAGAVLVTVVGRIAKTDKGFRLEKVLDKVFDRIPFLGSVYNITKVTTETVFGGAEDLSRPVKIKHGDIRINGFKTGNRSAEGREIVFMPTAPNITSGLVLELPDDRIEETDESAEEALTRILSAGFGQENQGKEQADD
jgi:uncharacterized membrane protein